MNSAVCRGIFMGGTASDCAMLYLIFILKIPHSQYDCILNLLAIVSALHNLAMPIIIVVA